MCEFVPYCAGLVVNIQSFSLARIFCTCVLTGNNCAKLIRSQTELSSCTTIIYRLIPFGYIIAAIGDAVAIFLDSHITYKTYEITCRLEFGL